MFKKFFSTILILLYSSILYGFNKFKINNIQFKGLYRVSFKTAISKINFKKGDIINQNDVRNIILSLFSTNNFEKINILKNKNNLIIQVKEYPIIKKINILGNKFLEKSFIKKYLKNLKITEGSYFKEKTIFQFKQLIQELYYDIGKFNSSIKIIKFLLPYNLINLKIIINEGHSAKIKQINIIGNKKFKSSTLIEQFKLKNNFSLLDFFIDKKYKKEKFIQGIKNLRKFYFERGFIKFTINSAYINLTKDKKNVYLTVNITEGEKYYINRIEIKEIEKYYYNQISKLINIKPKSIYNNTEIKKIIKKIKNLLKKDGYFYPKIFDKIKINENKKTIDLNIHIYKGKRLYVRKIYFKGNYITQDSVLRSEIQQMEGTWINKKLIKSSVKKLNQTGFFEFVKIKIKPVKNISNQVDIIYKIKERNTGSINLGMGIGTQSGISFQIALQEDNLFGSGKSIKILANKNNFSNYSELSLIDSYFTKKNFKLSEQIFYNNFNAKNAHLSGYRNKFYGIDSSITIPFNENNKFNLGGSFIKNFLSNIKPQASILRYLTNINKNIKFNEIKKFNTNDYTININWIFNTLNNKIFPTKGNHTLFQNKITIPGSINKYFKIDFHTSQYFPLEKNKKWILFYQGEIGYGNGLYGKELPFYNNFYLGGIENLRGFYTNNIGPKAVYLEKDRNNQIYPKPNSPLNDSIGGNMMIFSSLELIFPTPFANKNYNKLIRTSFFIDAGNVWDSNWEKTPKTWIKNIPNYGDLSKIRFSIGTALRVISPIGPLIFSYSKPLKFFNEDKIEEFQFNIGKTW